MSAIPQGHKWQKREMFVRVPNVLMSPGNQRHAELWCETSKKKKIYIRWALLCYTCRMATNWPCHFTTVYRMTAKSTEFFFFPKTFIFLSSFKMLPILEFLPLRFTLPCLYSCLGVFLVSAHRSGNGSPSEESLPAILVCPQEHTATYSRAFPLDFFFQPFDAK